MSAKVTRLLGQSSLLVNKPLVDEASLKQIKLVIQMKTNLTLFHETYLAVILILLHYRGPVHFRRYQSTDVSHGTW